MESLLDVAVFEYRPIFKANADDSLQFLPMTCYARDLWCPRAKKQLSFYLFTDQISNHLRHGEGPFLLS